PAWRRGLAVVATDLPMLGTDDEADIVQSRVGESRENVIQEGTACSEGDHRLDPAAGRLLLVGIEARARIPPPHARPEPAREDDGFPGAGGHAREAHSAGTRRRSQTPLTRKTPIQAAACAVFP